MDERPAKKFGKWCEDSYAAQGVSDAFALGLRTLENFFSTGDRWTVENGHPFAHLAKSPTKFLKPWAASQKPLATARRGPAAVSSIEAFEEDARRIAAGESLF
jgi:hypothetical protein